jgi:hypothetical protein
MRKKIIPPVEEKRLAESLTYWIGVDTNTGGIEIGAFGDGIIRLKSPKEIAYFVENLKYHCRPANE